MAKTRQPTRAELLDEVEQLQEQVETLEEANADLSDRLEQISALSETEAEEPEAEDLDED